jgi:hypothetical protein
MRLVLGLSTCWIVLVSTVIVIRRFEAFLPYIDSLKTVPSSVWLWIASGLYLATMWLIVGPYYTRKAHRKGRSTEDVPLEIVWLFFPIATVFHIIFYVVFYLPSLFLCWLIYGEWAIFEDEK